LQLYFSSTMYKSVRLSNFDTLDAVAPIAEPGCSNHVFAIACTMRDGNNISYKEFVLKVCKTERNSIKTLNEVNVLRALCSILPPQHQKFPRVVAFEHDTSRSEIGAAYILMERISVRRFYFICTLISTAHYMMNTQGCSFNQNMENSE